MKIPEDLKVWYSVACDGVHFQTDYAVIKTLIERIARTEAHLRGERMKIKTYACWEDAVNKDGEFFDAVRLADYQRIEVVLRACAEYIEEVCEGHEPGCLIEARKLVG